MSPVTGVVKCLLEILSLLMLVLRMKMVMVMVGLLVNVMNYVHGACLFAIVALAPLLMWMFETRVCALALPAIMPITTLRRMCVPIVSTVIDRRWGSCRATMPRLVVCMWSIMQGLTIMLLPVTVVVMIVTRSGDVVILNVLTESTTARVVLGLVGNPDVVLPRLSSRLDLKLNCRVRVCSVLLFSAVFMPVNVAP